MPSCAAVNCTNRTGKKYAIIGRSFHRFPLSNPGLTRQWLVSMRRDKFTPVASSRLCSDHFTEQCFDRTGQSVRLRDDAVPTVFQFPEHLIKKQKTRKPPMVCTVYSTVTSDAPMADPISDAEVAAAPGCSPTTAMEPGCCTTESPEKLKQKLNVFHDNTHLVDKTGQNVVLHKFTDTTESHLHGQRQQDETKPRKPDDCDRPGAKNKRDHTTVGTVSARKRMKKLPANVHPPGTFEAVRSDAYRLVVESKVWHILDDGSDSNSLTIGIIQRHQSFLSVRITAEDLMAEVAVYGIPRQTKDSLADKSLTTLMDEISSMSVCPGIVEPELQCLADFPQHGEQRAFFRHLTYSLDGDSWTHSSRILSTNCARLITPSENICTACESVYKHLLSTE